MIGKRTEARRRTVLAVALSVAGHAAIVVLIALDLHREPVEYVEPAFVEITMTPPPLNRPVERPAPPAQPAEAATPATTSPSARRPVVAQSPVPAAFPTLVPGPPAPLAGPATPPAEDLPSALRTGCVGKRGLDTKARVDCKLEIWTFLDGKPAKALPGDAIPDDKQAGYDAVARAQAWKRRKVYPGGNATTIGCPHGNLGAGCLDEMLIPLTGSAAKK